MGYYVQLIDSNAVIPAKHLELAYKRMCALNEDNSLKTGGCWPRSETPGANPNVWFAWMPWDYPEVYTTARQILEMLGFFTQSNEHGDLQITGYDDKTGNEWHFLNAIGDLVESSDEREPLLRWRGEDGDEWEFVFNEEER
jgi:hypothetical protein